MEGGFFVNIHESAEDYLETILKLRKGHGMVRTIDIVHELGFSKPGVSIAMRNLRENRPPRLALWGRFSLMPFQYNPPRKPVIPFRSSPLMPARPAVQWGFPAQTWLHRSGYTFGSRRSTPASSPGHCKISRIRSR